MKTQWLIYKKTRMSIPFGSDIHQLKDIEDLRALLGQDSDEWCHSCDEVMPMNHFTFVDGIAIVEPNGSIKFLGVTSCQNTRVLP